MFKLRFWKVVLFAIFRLRNAGKSHMRFWCTPFDCDIYLHCNNGCYLKFMDLGRWDLIIRSELAKAFVKQGVRPVTVRVEIDFKKSIQPFQFFTVDSTFESMQEKTVKIRQRFFKGPALLADALVTVVFLRKGRIMAMEELRRQIPEIGSHLTLQ